MADATTELYDLLRTNWDPSRVTDRNGNQVLANPPLFHTGYYDRDGPKPSVAIHSKDEGPTGGGQTGLYGVDQTGLGMQLIAGALNIDFVAGSRSDCESVGPNGESKNPKQVRAAMESHGAQLLLDHQRSTSLRTVVPGDSRELEDVDDGPAIFRIQLRARYTFTREPHSTQSV